MARPLIFIIGILTTIYVVVEWIEGHIQYSIEGYTGNGIYGIIHFFDSKFVPHSTFMTLVYTITLLFGLLFMWIGLTGGKK